MAKKKINYQETQAKLQSLLAELQGDQLSIDEHLEKYQEAHRLVDELEDYLLQSKNKITEIIDKQAKNNQ